MLKDLSKQDRRSLGMAPHVVVMEGMVSEGQRVCVEREVEGRVDPVRAAFIAYEADLPTIPAKRLERILDDWRYARWRSTYSKQTAIFEIGISPIASPLAHTTLKMILLLLTQTVDGEQRHGVAPKTQLELRLEQALKGLGAWEKRNDHE
jgi:hypothetical protein